MKTFNQHILEATYQTKYAWSPMSQKNKQKSEKYGEYIVRQNPKDKLWYAMGYVGNLQYMPVSDGFRRKLQAVKWAKGQKKVDVAARKEVGGI